MRRVKTSVTVTPANPALAVHCLDYRKPYHEGRGALELAAANAEMLAEFADLSGGDCGGDGRLLRFATRYGGLGLCKEHGWPFAHRRPHCPTDRSETADGCSYREKIKDWRNFTAYARAIVIALTAQRGPDIERARFILNKGGDVDENRAIIRWLAGSEIKLWFPPRPSGMTFFGVPPLWTGIGLQLAMLAAGAQRIILCSTCGRTVMVKRRRRDNPFLLREVYEPPQTGCRRRSEAKTATSSATACRGQDRHRNRGRP